jgi:hypothetical protein
VVGAYGIDEVGFQPVSDRSEDPRHRRYGGRVARAGASAGFVDKGWPVERQRPEQRGTCRPVGKHDLPGPGVAARSGEAVGKGDEGGVHPGTGTVVEDGGQGIRMPGEHCADIAQSRRQGDPIGVRLRRGPCLRPDRTEERGVQRDGVAAGRVATGGGHERRDGGQGRRGGARIHRAVPPRHQMVEDQRSGGAGQRGEEPGARRFGVVLERASDPEDRVVRNAPRRARTHADRRRRR